MSSFHYPRYGGFAALLLVVLLGGLCAAQENPPSDIQFNFAGEEGEETADAPRSTNGDRGPEPDEVRQELKPISKLKVDVLRAPTTGAFPTDYLHAADPDTDMQSGMAPRYRGFAEQSYLWAASGLVHNPLYFEDISLERHGQTHVLQPAVSGAKFFASVPILPYKIGLDPPRELIYTLGHERPGNPAPPVREHLPFSLRGAALAAGAATGFVFLFP